jgi:O-antigen/teichoic acid export membrane protein
LISFRFLKSSLIYTLSGALPLATGLLLVGFYARFLDAVQYGKLSLYMGFILLMQVVMAAGLETSFQFFYLQDKDQPALRARSVSTVFSSILTWGVIVILLSLVIGPVLFSLVFDLDFFPLGLMALGAALGNALLKAYNHLLIMQQRALRYFLVNLLTSVIIFLVTTFYLYYNPNTLTGPMLARLLAAIVVSAILLYWVFRETGFHWDVDFLKKIFPYCSPLLLMLILSWIQNYTDRIMISKLFNFNEVGIYDFAVKCTLVIDFIVAGLNSAVTPKVYAYWSEKKISHSTVEINRYWNAITSVIIICICITISAAPVVLEWIDTKQNYEGALKFIPLLSLVFLFRAFQMMSSAPLIYFKRTKAFPRIYLTLAFVQLVVSFIAIYFFGPYGAIAAIFAVKILELILLYSESKKVFSYAFNKIKIIGLPAAFFVAVVAVQVLARGRMWLILNYTLSAFTVMAIAALYRKEIVYTLTTWRTKALKSN